MTASSSNLVSERPKTESLRKPKKKGEYKKAMALGVEQWKSIMRGTNEGWFRLDHRAGPSTKQHTKN